MDAVIGKREAKHRANTQRILAAAKELFESHSYDGVTTAMISRAAGVSTGTLFRHIGSKASLLVSVVKETLLRMPPVLHKPATNKQAATDAILELVNPFLEMAVKHPKNAIAFQREVLYGDTEARDVVDRVRGIEQRIGDIICELKGEPNPDLAHAVYSSMYMDFLQTSTGKTDMADLPARMRHSVQTALEHWQ